MTGNFPATRNAALAIVFPGQGSQSVRMLAELAQTCGEVQETFDQASGVLEYDLWKLVQGGADTELNRTDRTQPAMFAAGVAVWRAWVGRGGPAPAFMAGHSLGEYTALTCAGALDFVPGVRLVAERARLMQQAVPEGVGAMAAILGLDSDQVIRICDETRGKDVVAAVNFNSPQQVVVAGHAAAVERVMDAAKEGGAKRALRLAVSVPSHCMLMKPAAQEFASHLASAPFTEPRVPVIGNVSAAVFKDVAAVRRGLAEQLYSPVRWVETIQSMAARGVNTVVEAGPGKVLTGLTRRIQKSLTALPVFDPGTLDKALQLPG